jgi:hypothetical protein
MAGPRNIVDSDMNRPRFAVAIQTNFVRRHQSTPRVTSSSRVRGIASVVKILHRDVRGCAVSMRGGRQVCLSALEQGWKRLWWLVRTGEGSFLLWMMERPCKPQRRSHSDLGLVVMVLLNGGGQRWTKQGLKPKRLRVGAVYLRSDVERKWLLKEWLLNGVVVEGERFWGAAGRRDRFICSSVEETIRTRTKEQISLDLGWKTTWWEHALRRSNVSYACGG